MDEEKAKKFLSHADFARLDCIHYSDMSLGALNTLYENVKHRHKHRAELLGIVDRLLATTAGYAAQVETLGNGVNAYAAFGHLKPWFGGPQAGLTLKPEAYDRVFGQHNGVAWSYGALSQRVGMLEAENKSLRKLADKPKPMAILDDAQGYYTVTDPFDKNGRVTVKQITERNARQFETIQRKDETIQRKDEKILEQAKEIKGLKEQNAGILAAGLIPPQAQVQLPNGGVLMLDDLIQRYLSQARIINRLNEEADSYRPLKTKLRQTQEDLGDMTVAHNKACETIDKLNARLDKIDEMALDISHVADGSTDPEEENGESVSVDFETRGVSPVGWDFGKPGGDFTVVAYVYDPVTGSIKRKD